MRLGLSARVSLQAALVLGLALLAFGWYWNAQRQTESEVAERAAGLLAERARADLAIRAVQTVDYLGLALVNPLFYVDLLSIQDLLEPVQRQDDVAAVVVYDSEGRLIHDGSVDLAAFAEQVADAVFPQGDQASVSWRTSTLEVTAPIRLDDRLIGAVRVQFRLNPIEAESAAARAAVDQQLAELHRRRGWSLAALGAVILILGVLAAWLISRGLLRPIQQLAVQSRQLAAGRYPTQPLASKRQDELGELVRAFAHMSEAVALHEAAMRREAQEDSLTGLANRRRFREHLDHALLQVSRRDESAALVFFDLDAFKQVNDALGHESGDQLLRDVASVLSEASEAVGLGRDGIIARLGGDEFLALFSGSDAESRARLCAARVLEDLHALRTTNWPTETVSASAGLAIYPEHGEDPRSLLKAADLAMYAAKRAGGGQLCRYEAVALAPGFDNLVADLRQVLALSEPEQSELYLDYQPIIALANGNTVGVEALLRWHHPKLGELPPVAFLQPALRAGLGVILGRFTCARALRDLQDWLPAKPGRFVSLNVDRASWHDGQLGERLLNLLAAHQLRPEQLRLELPERLYSEDLLVSQAQGLSLYQAGIQLWLDDVDGGGEGASALRHFRVNGIKLEQRLIAKMLTRADDLRQVRALLQIAGDAQLGVIAEGVETKAQSDLLIAAGCVLGQGFGLIAPRRASELA